MAFASHPASINLTELSDIEGRLAGPVTSMCNTFVHYRILAFCYILETTRTYLKIRTHTKIARPPVWKYPPSSPHPSLRSFPRYLCPLGLRVRVRGVMHFNFLIRSPHPNLLPEGEGAIIIYLLNCAGLCFVSQINMILRWVQLGCKISRRARNDTEDTNGVSIILGRNTEPQKKT